MDQQDVFVEKFVTFRKMVTPEQLQQAKDAAAGRADGSLLDVLRGMGLIGDRDAAAVLQLYEKNLGDRARTAAQRAPARPAESPAATPSAAPTPEPAPPPTRAWKVSEADAARIASFTCLHDYLRYARDVDASDLHINVGCPPVVRRYGSLVRLPAKPLAATDTERLLFAVLSEEQRKRIGEEKGLDFCYTVPGQGRYRTSIVKQRLGWDGAFRVVNAALASFEELGIPEQVRRFINFHQGMILLSGPNGCGKSTTMAALVELINGSRADHIVTIEDPIEFEFVPAKAQISQREVGVHTGSFAAALMAALREDPDVVVIGELRDLETMSLALRAAETGHLVFGTLHTTSAARTIDRILDVFPAEEQAQVRNMVSESIRGIACQQLLPRKDGNGRALALEVMVNTPAVGNMIRERKLFQMPSVLQTGKKQGMQLMDNALLDLVKDGVIDGIDAYYAADNKGSFQQWAPKVEDVICEE
jgi:twitching motility protein PilT